MKIEATIKQVEVPIDENTAKVAYAVYYCVSGGQRVPWWVFHSVYTDEHLAEFVKKGIEEGMINVIYQAV
ncbi:hypothetical protein ACR77V_12550 [Staphylococcus epidermidis]|uniref:hypothetical protein n=1 Tax=Staphylococcus epidermidis TaxID=1282 RepID=UPI003DA3C5E9